MSAPHAGASAPNDQRPGEGSSAYKNHDQSSGSSVVSEHSYALSGHEPTDHGSVDSTDTENQVEEDRAAQRYLEEEERLAHVLADPNLSADRRRRYDAMMFAWNTSPDMIWFASPELRRNRRYWEAREQVWRAQHGLDLMPD